jgi:predicted metalloendopeptidase
MTPALRWLAAIVAVAAGVPVLAAPSPPRPQDDFYGYANADWLNTTAIPDDRSSHGVASELFDRVEADVHSIIEAMAALPNRRAGSAAQQVVDLYRSVVDEATLDQLGSGPLRPTLSLLSEATDIRAVAHAAGVLTATTTAGPFFSSLGPHPSERGVRGVRLSPGGLLLERVDLVTDDASTAEIRRRYRDYLERLFTLTEWRQPAQTADAVLEFEIALARAMRTGSRIGGAPHITTPDRMPVAFPGFDWVAWALPQGMTTSTAVFVQQPAFFRLFAMLMESRPVETSAAWLAARCITALSPYVTESIADARFQFFGKYLTGQPAPRARWKRGVGMVNTVLPDLVGRPYVERRLPRESRDRVERIARQVLSVYREAVSRFDWPVNHLKLAAETRVGRLDVRIGAPASWRNYSGLTIKPDDLFGNFLRAQKYDNNRRMAQGGHLALPGQWPLGAQTVTSYYYAATNVVILPAGMLQPPYFDPAGDDATNYGAIGAAIGHEVGHALDGSSRRVPTGFNNESFNDAVGLAVAWEAFRRSRDTRDAQTAPNPEDQRRFFLAWARVWREMVRPPMASRLALTSQYPKGDARANGAVQHLEAFYRAFDVGPSDRMYLAPERRIRLF